VSPARSSLSCARACSPGSAPARASSRTRRATRPRPPARTARWSVRSRS
jgi:hypothetical protein